MTLSREDQASARARGKGVIKINSEQGGTDGEMGERLDIYAG